MRDFFMNIFKKLFGKKKKAPTPVVVKPIDPPAPGPVVVKPIDPPTEPEEPTKERREIPDFKFVDTSHHHPFFDPKKYPAPILSNKCTQGNTFVDKTFAERKKLCAEHGIKYSGYHFYECKIDPIKQVDHYLKTHGPFELPPQVDFETYKTNTSSQTEADLMADKEDLYTLLCEIEKRTGKTPWLYVNYSAAGRLKFDKKFGRFPVWFARYNSTLGTIPFPWSEETTAAWQYTESGTFGGFSGGNDVNIYFGKVNVLNL